MYHVVISDLSEKSSGIENSEDSDHTAPSGAVWTVVALSAQDRLSQHL